VFRLRREQLILVILLIITVLAIAAFMTVGARGKWEFILKFRGLKLLALILVAVSVAISTVLFQTITNNKILTPAVMGFDSLFIFGHTLVFFIFGSEYALSIDPRLRFVADTLILVFFASILYYWLFSGSRNSLHLLVLVGIIFGVLFRSLANFMQRILDPNEFVVLRDTLFASFNSVDTTLLFIALAVVIAVLIAGSFLFNTFDVLALGRDIAINLGINHKKVVTILLVLIAILVAVSTALVGPIMFFGLLVASLAHYILGVSSHKYILPGAILLAIICLVGGQVILEKLFAFNTALAIVIEFIGGLVFITLVLRQNKR